MAKRILAVDDSKTMRDMVGMTLRSAGHEVLESPDGAQAMQVLGRGKVDLVVTDLNMPVMDGIGLIRAIRAAPLHRAVPIVVLTTESEGSKKQEAKLAGATGWIVKPFQPDKLLDVVKRLCP